MKTITVTLPDELVKHLEERVATGEFDSFDDALACAAASVLPYTGSNRITAETTIDELRAMLQVGIDQADRGQVVDGEEAMAKLEQRMKAKLAALALPARKNIASPNKLWSISS